MVDPISPATPAPLSPDKTEQLREIAKDLEASFLSEMLKSAGLGEARDSFGGGIGEEQFSSFLREQHAQMLVETGGIGLAETLFNALKERSSET
ncbi:rod-binding protein [Litoreibacter roseus]|uniref:Chemotaxis protein CheL n=1 Tax=Litoreibacter roseus TaxID=2601869 RepID=A0A6N6JGS7_9RHOB|nr:rod-binding protein [Litoreibacter roseus]GFE64422.1 chemotaxis protein CheL [Litoreibacter roseus]